MADHVAITLWVDRRWKDAIAKHLKGETLQEHLEDVLDTAELLQKIEGTEEVAKMDALLSLAITGGDCNWI